MNLLKSNVLLRLCLKLFALITFYFGLYVPQSLLFRIANETDYLGYWSMVAVMPLALFGLVDILVNDLMADRFHNRPGLRWRHLNLGALAMMFAIQISSCGRHGYPLASMAYYMLFVVFLPLSAIADVALRYSRTDVPMRGPL